MSAGRAFTGIDVKRRSRCDAPSAGRGGFTWTATRCEVHLCEGSCRVLAPPPRGGDGSLTGAAASTDQLPIRHTHTHTYTEASVTTRILWGTMCSRTSSHLYFHTLFQGGFTETDLQQDVKSSHPDPFQFMMQVLTHKRGSQVNKK